MADTHFLKNKIEPPPQNGRILRPPLSMSFSAPAPSFLKALSTSIPAGGECSLNASADLPLLVPAQ